MLWPVVALATAGPSLALLDTVGRLGATDARTREAAGRVLLAAGQRAVGPLIAATGSPDPEVRRAAATLLDRIEVDRLSKPTLISLNFERSPVAEVVAELARQSGYKLSLSRDVPATATVTVHCDRVPFLEAVGTFCGAAKLRAHGQGGGSYHLAPADDDNASDPFVSFSGPFRVVATEVYACRRRSLSWLPAGRLPPPEPEEITLSFMLSAEPKMTVLELGPVRVLVADDDLGISLKRPADGDPDPFAPNPFAGRAGSHAGFGFDLTLVRRDAAARTIRRLKGTVSVSCHIGNVPDVEIDLTAKPWRRPHPGRTATLTVSGVKADEGLYTVELTAKTPTRGESNHEMSFGLEPRLVLTDAAGRVWPHFNTSHGMFRDGMLIDYRVTYRRPDDTAATPAKLRLLEYRTRTRDVTFEFKDIPLP